MRSTRNPPPMMKRSPSYLPSPSSWGKRQISPLNSLPFLQLTAHAPRKMLNRRRHLRAPSQRLPTKLLNLELQQRIEDDHLVRACMHVFVHCCCYCPLFCVSIYMLACLDNVFSHPISTVLGETIVAKSHCVHFLLPPSLSLSLPPGVQAFDGRKGYMYKMGGRHKTWKLRYFVLMPGQFSYYKNDPVSPFSLSCYCTPSLPAPPSLSMATERKVSWRG